jgi:hypothetical protein
MSINYLEKETCWCSLTVMKDTLFVNKSIIAGDYNVVLYNSEKRGGNIIKDPFKERR